MKEHDNIPTAFQWWKQRHKHYNLCRHTIRHVPLYAITINSNDDYARFTGGLIVRQREG